MLKAVATTCSASPQSDPFNIPKLSAPEKSMEDVWNDLSLPPSFSDHPTSAAASAVKPSVAHGLNFHDFLGRPLFDGDPVIATPTANSTLKLNSERPTNLEFANGSSHLSLKNKRAREENGEDSRYKRMMKNRESAARSRARRQAYTYELELEIAHLHKENAKLRKKLENKDMSLAKEAPAIQLPKKNSLQRTLTAPF